MAELDYYEQYIFPQELLDKVSSLPLKPGVYLHKNKDGKIIYVGKALKLRNRVRNYFQDRPMDAKTKVLVRKIADFDFIVTDSEAEALILEDTLIKEHKPKYNILLKDDKTYPYIRVTNEPYPRVFSTRTVIKDGSKYFGPYTDLKSQKYVLRALRDIFKLRSCEFLITEDSILKKKHKVCLDYHIKKCEGPCEGLISQIKYNENIKQAITIINGRTRDLEKDLEEKMNYSAENFQFEEAAAYRDKLSILQDYSSKQKIISQDLADRDVIGIARQEETACAVIFKIRDGKLLGKRHYLVPNAYEQNEEDIVQRALERWYIESDFIPREIFVPCQPSDVEYLSGWLGEKRGNTVSLILPKIGDKKKLIDMAISNGEAILREYYAALEKREQIIPRAVQSLQRDLRLTKTPRIIECFDNSHFQGTDLVSSMVHFEDGKPKKSEYRKFKNKTVLRNDDFATMRETVHRRYERLIQEIKEYNELKQSGVDIPEDKRIPKLPDLIIIDGGKGQLSSAVEVLTELNLMDKIVVIGLAKRLEEIFFPGISDSVLLPKTSSSLRLIQHLRDEAHRFAITFHRSLRDKRTLQTELSEIEGIGEKTAIKLLTELGSVENIKRADLQTLKNFVNDKIAIKILEHFQNKAAE